MSAGEGRWRAVHVIGVNEGESGEVYETVACECRRKTIDAFGAGKG